MLLDERPELLATMAGDLPAITLQTSMHFLKKQKKYKTEKPYSLRFVPPPGFPRSNIVLEKHDDIIIEDARPNVSRLSFEEHGFEIMPLNTSMSYKDFEVEDLIKEFYLREVADTLRDRLGAKHVHIFEHTVRSLPVLNRIRRLLTWLRCGGDIQSFRSLLASRTSGTNRLPWRILVRVAKRVWSQY